MFYLAASLGPSEMRELINHQTGLWPSLVRRSKERPRLTFLETHRLVLLPFHQVLIQSDALRLAVCHYVRASPDQPPSADGSPTAEGGTRGGISMADLGVLMDICLVVDKPLRDELLRQVTQPTRRSILLRIPFCRLFPPLPPSSPPLPL